MNKIEATWIAISALQWIIHQIKSSDADSPEDLEHLAEKEQALEILLAYVNTPQ